jgi:hypothetical protein
LSSKCESQKIWQVNVLILADVFYFERNQR